MGNDFEIDLGKYDCSCFKGEDGYFFDFMKEFKNNELFNTMTTIGKSSSTSAQKENIPGGLYYSNHNKINSDLKKGTNIKKKLNLFSYSESENENSNLSSNRYNTNNINNINNINDDEEQKEKDIKEFDKKTDYFQLANQINNAINELKMNLYSSRDEIMLKSLQKSTPTPDSQSISSICNFNFQKLIKKAGKNVDKICFTDIIGCIKKISDIHSEVILMKEKIYLGIANKFKKIKNDKYLINYEDEEKIVDLPNFEDIKEKNRLKLGEKFNNPKFKFNKFSLKGSFPNEILIWNLISQNTQRIADILTDNYYCCLVLLYYSKVEEENETIMYLVNKPINI